MLKNKNISSPPFIRSDSALNTKKPVRLLAVVMLIILVAVLPPARAADPVWTYSSPGSIIGSVSVSSDGSVIAVGADKIWLFSRSGEFLSKEPFGDHVVLTPNGLHLLSSYASTLYFFERNVSADKANFSFRKKWEYNLPTGVRSIDISEDGNTLVASSQASGTYVFSSLGKLTGSKERYSALVRVASNGGKILGVSVAGLFQYSKTGEVTQYKDISIGSEPDVLEITSMGTTAVFNDDQRVVAVNTLDGTQRWKTRATGDVTALAMTPSGSGILVGTDNGDIDFFNSKGNLSWSYSTNPAGKPAAGIQDVALSNDGTIDVAGTYNGKIVALNAKGEAIWSAQTNDRIHHIAMSADGSLVVAAGEETVYAFSPSAISSPATRTTVPGTTPATGKSATTVPGNTVIQNPVPEKTVTMNPEIIVSPIRTITSVPTTYSIIRTPTQSPVPAIIPLAGLLGAALLVLRRR